MTAFEYKPLSEEEIWRANNMGDMWDAAERGEPIPVLLRERLRKTEAELLARFRPEFEKAWTEGTLPLDSGLGKLLSGD